MKMHSRVRTRLAILLTTLLATHLPVVPELRLVPQASAQVSLCLPSTPPVGQSAILQSCSADTNLETIAVNNWLDAHQIPHSERALIYQYGRAGLRSEIRAHMFVYLMSIIEKPAEDRTPEEVSIYNWFQNAVWTKQQAQYAAAIADRDSWLTNKCRWRPDTDVAAVHGLTYEASQYCGTNSLSQLFTIAPAMPSKDYFLGAALKNTYGIKVANTPGGTQALSNMNRDAAIGEATATALGLGAFLGVAVVGYLKAGAMFIHGGKLLIAGLKGLGATGPAAIILVGAIIGAIAVYEVAMNEKNLAHLQTLNADYQWNVANKPDLAGYARDAVGRYKLQLTFVENTLPDFPSTAPLPPPGGRMFVITPQGGAPQSSPGFTYRDWANTSWGAQTYGQWLVHNGLTAQGAAVSEFSPSFRFQDWNGTKYTASRTGFRFVVAKDEVADGDRSCEPDSTGVTPLTDVSKCMYYVTNAVKLKDSNGANVTVSIAGTPEFTSRTTGSVLVGSPSTFDIAATGNPAPAINLVSALPIGFSFENSTIRGPGQARITFNGTSLSSGDYSFTVLASNAQGATAQTVTLSVSTPVKILDPTEATFMAGKPFQYTISVAGSPRPAITCPANLGGLQGQVTFADNGNGSATFQGTLAAPPVGGGLQIPPSCTLRATNGITSDSKTVTFRSTPAPTATIITPTTATFAKRDTAGQPTGDNTLPIATSGAITPVSFHFPCGDQPSWLSVVSNGDGTGYLTGAPSTFAAATANFTLQAVAAGSQPPTPQCGTPNYTIRTQLQPRFADPLYGTLTVDFPYSFTTFGTLPGASITLSGTLPENVQFFDGGFGSWTLSGLPPVGSGGEYGPDLTMTINGVSATRKMRLIVLEKPNITSSNMAIFPVGLNTSFRVFATGFPKAQLDGIPGLNSNAMRFTITGALPPGLSFRDTDTTGAGIPVGAGVIHGTPQPGTTGSYPLTITANNGVFPASTQQFTLLVTLAGDVNNDTRVDCTDASLVRAAFGAYRGTARYDLRADINSDGVVDVRDLSLVSTKLPAGTRCP